MLWFPLTLTKIFLLYDVCGFSWSHIDPQYELFCYRGLLYSPVFFFIKQCKTLNFQQRKLYIIV